MGRLNWEDVGCVLLGKGAEPSPADWARIVEAHKQVGVVCGEVATAAAAGSECAVQLSDAAPGVRGEVAHHTGFVEYVAAPVAVAVAIVANVAARVVPIGI